MAQDEVFARGVSISVKVTSHAKGRRNEPDARGFSLRVVIGDGDSRHSIYQTSAEALAQTLAQAIWLGLSERVLST